jgi:hypothetical protein
MGLLTKITNTDTVKPYFSAFCKKYGFIHAGIFSIVDGMYVLSHANGFDVNTVIRSISSRDFWNGIVPSSDCWVSLSRSNQTITDFYQFFSDKTKDSLCSLSILKYTANGQSKIFFVAQFEGEHLALPAITPEYLVDISSVMPATIFEPNDDIDNVLEQRMTKGVCTPFVLSIDSELQQSLSAYTITTTHLYEQIKNTVFEELYWLLITSFGPSAIVVPKRGYFVNIVLFSSEHIDTLFLQFHLSQFLKNMLDSSVFNSQFVSFSDGITTPSELSHFLKSV